MQDLFQTIVQPFLIPNLFPILFKATGTSLKLFAFTLLLSLPLALPVALGRMTRLKIVNYPVRAFLLVMRGTPLILQLAVVYFLPAYVLNWNWGERFTAAVVAYAINYAAYFAEIYRGGIESIAKGQYEAGKVLGLNKMQTFFKVVLPQVIKRILPACGNEFMTLIKDTALMQTIGVIELMRQATSISSRTASMIPYVVAGVIFLVINSVVEKVFHVTEKRLQYYQ